MIVVWGLDVRNAVLRFLFVLFFLSPFYLKDARMSSCKPCRPAEATEDLKRWCQVLYAIHISAISVGLL